MYKAINKHPSIIEIIEPIVVEITKFNKRSVKELRDKINDAVDCEQKILPIIIDSFGGDVYSLIEMMGCIEDCDLIVATIVNGKAMSAGAMLFMMGTEGYRFMAPNSTLMIHDVISDSEGKISDIKVDVKQSERLSKIVFTMASINIGQSKEYLYEFLKEKNYVDCFLTAKECKRMGICSHIKTPRFVTNINVGYEIG